MNDEIEAITKKLKEPFERKDVEFRVAKVSKRTKKVLVLAYITSRTVMDRLDKVVGIDGWKDEYQVMNNGVSCKLSLKINGDFVSKEDAAQFGEFEPLKSAYSGSFKRSATKFGVGRYLYQLPEYWVDLLEKKPSNGRNRIHYYHSDDLKGYWVEPDLTEWAVKNGKKVEKENGKTGKMDKREDKSGVDSSDDLRPLLIKKMDYLLKKNIITPKKHADYRLKITDDETGKGLLNYFLKQFELLYRMYKLLELNKISENQQKKLYQRIMSSKSTGLSLIDKDLHQMEDIS